MDDMAKATLVELYDSVEYSDELSLNSEGPFVISGFGESAIKIEGDNFARLQSLTNLLSAPALLEGGPSKIAVDDAIIRSCRIALEQGNGAGVLWLDEWLGRPLEDWTIGRSIRGHFPVSPLQVGRSEIHTSLPESFNLTEDSAQRMLLSTVHLPIIFTIVGAKDADAAIRRGLDIIEESLSVLALMDQHASHRHAVAYFPIGHRAGFRTGSDENFTIRFASTLDDSPIEGLHKAAATTANARSDWQGRALSAARWYRKASNTIWPAESLSASMTALESVIIKDFTTRHKGTAIADFISPKLSVAGMDAGSMHSWIKGLYQRRNEAVHNGVDYLEDIEVEKLLAVVDRVTRWASDHLNQSHGHSSRRGPCQTFDEAHTWK
jgi:hypothetical protein